MGFCGAGTSLARVQEGWRVFGSRCSPPLSPEQREGSVAGGFSIDANGPRLEEASYSKSQHVGAYQKYR